MIDIEINKNEFKEELKEIKNWTFRLIKYWLYISSSPRKEIDEEYFDEVEKSIEKK